MALHYQPASDDKPVAVVTADQEGQIQTTVEAPNEPGAYEVVASVEGEEVAREVVVVDESRDETAAVGAFR